MPLIKASARFRPLSLFFPPTHPWTRTAMRSLTVDSLNPAVRNVQYAVRGELAIKAEEYRVILKEKGQNSGLPFDRVISSNIGNPQQKGLDQPPITFNRQVSFILFFPPRSCRGAESISHYRNRLLHSWSGHS